jgi:hypothetical protein
VVIRAAVDTRRRKRWMSVGTKCHAAAALQVSVSASASSVIISEANVTLASVRAIMHSWQKTTKVIPTPVVTVESQLVVEGGSCHHAMMSARRLRRTAHALLPKASQTAADLEAILRRIVILNPKTVACMIKAAKESRKALQELTPCQMTLRAFQARCGGDDDDSKLLYKIVKEAVEQCDDIVEYYSSNPSFYPTKRFSGQTLPPFASYDDDDLQQLSDKYWQAEIAIQSIHRQAAPDCRIDPGFSGECISILCHAFEAGALTSPIGVQLFCPASSSNAAI